MTTFIKDPDARPGLFRRLVEVADWRPNPNERMVRQRPGPRTADDSNTPTRTTVWLSGGIAGQSYTVNNRITTSGGRTNDRSFVFQVHNPLNSFLKRNRAEAYREGDPDRAGPYLPTVLSSAAAFHAINPRPFVFASRSTACRRGSALARFGSTSDSAKRISRCKAP